MEKNLQKCAVAAFEVPASLDVAEYEQTLLPVAVAGASARVGKAKLSRPGSPQLLKAEGARASLTVFCPWEWISAAP